MTGQPAPQGMTVGEFLDWVRARPEGERWELIEGIPVPTRGPEPVHAMAAESVRHARIKRRIDQALGDGIRARGLTCEPFSAGVKVQIDATSAFEPDALVTCSAVPDGLLVPEPVIVVEVLSASTRDRDFTVKLAGYAGLPSVLHYLLVETERRLIVTTTGPPVATTSAPRSSAAGRCHSSRPASTSMSRRFTPGSSAEADRPQPGSSCQSSAPKAGA